MFRVVSSRHWMSSRLHAKVPPETSRWEASGCTVMIAQASEMNIGTGKPHGEEDKETHSGRARAGHAPHAGFPGADLGTCVGT